MLIIHPVDAMDGEVHFNFCPTCGSELVGVENIGIHIDTDDGEETTTEED